MQGQGQGFKLVFLADGTFSGVEDSNGKMIPRKSISDPDAASCANIQVETFVFIHKNPVCCIRHGNGEYCWC